MTKRMRPASGVLSSLSTRLQTSSNRLKAGVRMQVPHRTSTTSSDEQIHILGVGNLGVFFTTALNHSSNPPPLALHFHRSSLLPTFRSTNSTLTLLTPPGPLTVSNPSISLPDSNAPIKNLIITTKAPLTNTALSAISHRLGPTSTLLFTQNGLGLIEDVSSKIFPDIATRPQYLACVTTHGLNTYSPFNVVHAGQGSLSIGPVGINSVKPQTGYLMKAITDAPMLNAKAVDAKGLFVLQLQKLAVNALINPLTVIFHCKNGELAEPSNPNYLFIRRLQEAMIAEISAVFLTLEEIKGAAEKIREMFSTEGIRMSVQDVMWVTRENRSSMLQDVEKGRDTEVDWINGWVVKRGREVDLPCELNGTVVELVKRGFPKEGEDLKALFRGCLRV